MWITNFGIHWQPPQRSLDGYKHVVDVDYCPPVSSNGPHFPPEAAKAKETAQKAPNTQNTLEYHDIMEGELSIIARLLLYFVLEFAETENDSFQFVNRWNDTRVTTVGMEKSGRQLSLVVLGFLCP